MSNDWLSLIESAEVGAERAESMLRRHGRLILSVAVGVAAVVALFFAPSPETAVQTDAGRVPSTPPAPASARPSRLAATQAPPVGASNQPAPAVGGRTPQAAPPIPTAVTVRASAAPIYVHVAGAVARPGVVRLAPSARAFEAVRAAGGLLPEADLDRVNLAVRLRDEAMVTVPRRAPLPSRPVDDGGAQEAVPAVHADATGSTPDASAATLDGSASPPPDTERPSPSRTGKTSLETLWRRPLSLGTAGVDDLARVPGIGLGLARAIVTYRARHGGFHRVEDLRRVPRFGARLFTRVHRCFVL